MSDRFETLINQDLTVGFRHIYNGILQDVDEMIGVRVLDQNFNPIHWVTPDKITRVGLGSYETVLPGNLFQTPGTYYDIWEFKPLATSSKRYLRFEIKVVTQESAVQPQFESLLNCTLSDLDACNLKRYYLWPVRTSLANYYLPDSLLQHHIDDAISFMRHKLGVPLREMRVLTKPYDQSLSTPPVKGVDYDEDGYLLQWSSIDGEWSTVRLPHSNIIRVNNVRGIYNGRVVYRIPNDWVTGNEFKGGYFRIRATETGVNNYLIDESGQFLEWMLLEANGTNTVPGFWAVDYTYGSEDDQVPRVVCDYIMKKAAIVVLDQLGMEISRGYSSLSASVDGLSSTVGLLASAEKSLFGSLTTRYEQELSDMNLLDLRRTIKGPALFFM